MTFFRQVTPRRLILAGLAALALGLRLWGLFWGGGEGQNLGHHPSEWTWQIIESLSWSQPTFYGIWTQAFFSFAALLKNLADWVLGMAGVLTGELRNLSQLSLPALMAGRMTVALLGSGQVLLVYLVGRRYFDSVATGLIAAAAVAVSPLLVTQAHQLSLDVPLGFMVLVCLNASWHISEHPRARVMALAGLALGLTITTRASGVLCAPFMAYAFWLGVRQARPARSRWLAVWPLCFFGGLILGMVAGYPGILFSAENTQTVLETSINSPLAAGETWSGFWARRWLGSAEVLWSLVGLELLLLWLTGLALLVRRRRLRRVLVAIFPPLYFLAGVTVLSSPPASLAAVWLPVACILAVWPLVALCRKLSGFRWQVAGVTLLGLFLCAWPLWRSMQADYVYWQEDTAASAHAWIKENIPPGAKIMLGQDADLELAQPTQPLDLDRPLSALFKSGGYLLTAQGPGPAIKGLQRLKVFALKSPPLGAAADNLAVPPWVSRRLNLTAALPASRIKQPLALVRPGSGQERLFGVIYADFWDYSLAEGSLLLRTGRLYQRALRTSRPLERVGLTLSNQGQDLAEVELSQGPFPGRRVSLYPGQETSLVMDCRAWPPLLEGIYPFKFRLLKGGDFTVRLEWVPLLMARRALEAGKFQLAVDLLTGQGDAPREFDANAMLAEAYVRLGSYDEARQALLRSQPWVRAFEDLALSSGYGEKWDRELKKLTGYHPALLTLTSSVSYDILGAGRRPDAQGMSLKGPGFIGSLIRYPNGSKRLRLWPQQAYPKAGLVVRLKFSSKQKREIPGHIRATVWSHDAFGVRKLASERVLVMRLLQDGGVLRLKVQSPHGGTRLEVRASLPPALDLTLDSLAVGSDIQDHMKRFLRWHLDAKGMVALKAGRFEEAIGALGKLLKLDPDYASAYLPLAKAYLDTGNLDEAYKRTKRAEAYFASQPVELGQVHDLYQAMQRKDDAARVRQQLDHLRPSLKYLCRFAGGLSLLGYDLPKSQVAAGGQLAVNWYWRCWSPPPLDYFIFVHLRGKNRTLNYDHLLDHGRIAMPELEPGQVVREDYVLSIPKDTPPGRYRLVVGIWDPRFTGKGVSILEGKDKGYEEVTLAAIEVR